MKQPKSIPLYRFFGAAAGIRTIESKRFRVGRVMEFNDPFEWKLGITNYVPAGEPTVRRIQENLLRKMNSAYGVICFSDSAEDPVLWSHYADHHRGLALVVDHWVNDQLFSVTYSDERPTLDANRLNQPDAETYAAGVLKKMLAHKSAGWSYEREYRVFIDLPKCDVADGSYFTAIPPDFLKRVILGFRCAIDETYLRRSLDIAGFTDVEVVRARDDNESFKIHY